MTEPDLLRLDRIGSTPWGTLGRLELPGGAAFVTLEQPWRNNAKGESCIPAGVYPMEMRQSPMVYRTSAKQFARGWEIRGVPNRSLIMVHPGNWMDDSNGCILVGRQFDVIKGKPGITSSRAAFTDMMGRLSMRDDWRIEIRWVTPE